MLERAMESASFVSAESGSIGDLVIQQKQDEYVESSIVEYSGTKAKQYIYNPAHQKPSRFSATVALKRKTLQHQQAMMGESRLLLGGPSKVVVPRRPRTSINFNSSDEILKKRAETKSLHDATTTYTDETIKAVDNTKRDERIYGYIKSGYVDVKDLLFPLNPTMRTMTDRSSFMSAQSSYSSSTAIQRALSLDNIVSSPDPFNEILTHSTISWHLDADIDNRTTDMSVLTFDYNNSAPQDTTTNPATVEGLDEPASSNEQVATEFNDLDDSTVNNKDDRSQCSTISHTFSYQGDSMDHVQAKKMVKTAGVPPVINNTTSSEEDPLVSSASDRRDFMRMNHSKAMRGVKTLYPIKNKPSRAHNIILSSQVVGRDPLTSNVFVAGGKSALLRRSSSLKPGAIGRDMTDTMNELDEEVVKTCNVQESFQPPPLVVTSLIVTNSNHVNGLNSRNKSRPSSRSNSPSRPTSRGDLDATLYTKEYSVSNSNEISSSEFIPMNASFSLLPGAPITSVSSDIMDDLFGNRQFISVANTKVASAQGERRVALHSAGRVSTSLFEGENNSVYNARSVRSEQSHRRPKLVTNPSRNQQQLLLNKLYPDEHNPARGILAVKRQEKYKLILESYSKKVALGHV